MATVAPWRGEDMAKRERKGGGEWDSKEEGERLGVRGLGGVCYDMEIPACWSCWPVWGLDQQEGLWAWLTPTWCWLEPEYKEWTCHWLLLVNKPNTVGKMRCEAEDAAVSMLCLSLPLALAHQTPNFFLSCQQEIKDPPPCLHWCPELMNFLFYLFAMCTIEVSQKLALSSSCLKETLKTTFQLRISLATQQNQIHICHT